MNHLKKRSFSCKSFDIDLNMQPRRHSSFSNSQRGQTHNSIPDLNEEPPRHSSFVSPMSHQLSETEILLRQIPSIFHPYISSSSIQNVEPDGNCGFRSVALGLGHPEDYWPRIRWDLVHEIFNTYGPRMCIDDGHVVSNFVAQALRKEPMTVYSDGKQTRSFQYVSDLASNDTCKTCGGSNAVDGSQVGASFSVWTGSSVFVIGL
ncbi:putative ribonuclease H-like domain-containing protein [Tanacetum coccineum]